MKRTLYIITLLLLPLSAPAVIEEEDLTEIVADKYARFNRALVGKDLAAFAALCTSDCRIQIRPRGPRLSLDQFKKLREQGFRSTPIISARTSVDSVKVFGDRAVIHATWTGEFAAKTVSGVRKYRSVQKLQDTWSNVNSDWLLSASVVHSAHTGPLPQSHRR